MPVTEPLNFSQPDNELSQIAAQQRGKLFPKNDIKIRINTQQLTLTQFPMVMS